MHQQMMTRRTLHDPRQDSLRDRVAVLLEDSLICEVSDQPRHAQSIPCVGLRRCIVPPGPIDARRHLVLSGVSLQRLGEMPVQPFARGGSVAMRAITRACYFVKHAL